MKSINKKELERIIDAAFKEDIGSGDITTNRIVPKNKNAKAYFLAKEDGIIAGLNIAKHVLRKLDKKIIWKSFVKEGDKVSVGTKIAEVNGSLRALLTGERTALNFLQRISGIASITSKYVEALNNTGTKILDTRKTVPGLRMIDKYAVKTGGGTNHRIGLYDMALIKDNHIKAAGSISEAVRKVRSKNDKLKKKKKLKIEVETTNLDEVREALKCRVDMIMLDNMSPSLMKEAVKIINGKAKVEASGNMNIDKIRETAAAGVDFISVGALTHSVKALDISMKIEN
ncbi:MAG TPA: carboxylating nicotinate-nucleotide diphosphorylase [Ignavibacteriaceae bacterium]|nr:carboxylating nicotinate-nucleotide diphosphorylase [Ignavibacteriaceae bacterium]